ncbi:MAG: hypothetical protein WBX04_18360, partial [Candidatus Sulfotelmatobacter sp.]
MKVIRLRFIVLTALALTLVPGLLPAQTTETTPPQPAQQDQKPSPNPQNQNAGQSGSQSKPTTPPTELPNAPSSSKTEPSL